MLWPRRDWLRLAIGAMKLFTVRQPSTNQFRGGSNLSVSHERRKRDFVCAMATTKFVDEMFVEGKSKLYSLSFPEMLLAQQMRTGQSPRGGEETKADLHPADADHADSVERRTNPVIVKKHERQRRGPHTV